MQGVKIFTSVLLILCFGILASQANISISNPQNAPDLPNFQPNFQNLPAGSLIIPMDQQQIHDASGLQSLLPYGLVIRTLYENVSVSWAIATGKPLSGADFTAVTKSALFSAIATAPNAAAQSAQWNGWSAPTVRTYFGGPFVILANNVPKALAAYNLWKSNSNARFFTVKPTVYDNVVVHYLNTSTTVDIRHTINQRPFVAVSNLDGNAPTQTAMLGCVYQNSSRACPREDGSGWGSIFGTEASTGVPCGAFQPIDHAGLEFGTHYTTYDCGAQVVALTNADNCLATFSEPHWGWISTSGPTYITALKNFINSGANFLAQCASTESYENSGGESGTGTFLSNYGLDAINPSNGINLQPSESLNTLTNHPDLPISQWMGPISSAITGAVPDWYNLFSAEPDTVPAGWVQPTQVNSEAGYNNFKSNAYPIATNVYPVSSFNGRNTYIAAGVKFNANNKLGSNIFYLGGHTWAGVTTTGTDNGRRLLLNAIVIPALRPVSCGLFFCTPYAACSNNGNPCQTCQCDPSGSTFIYTPIPGCCLNNSVCTGACQTCNTATNKCVLTPGCCSPTAGINCTATCTQCSVSSGVGTCVGSAGCCQSNAQCGTGACVQCVNHACVTTQPPACCNTNVDCSGQKCFNCTNNVCQQASGPTCCLSNVDCAGTAAGPCSVCDTTTNQCVPKPGCCNSNAACGTNPCAECSNNVCVRKNPCCENTGQCAACTYCSNATNLCVPSTDKSCCTTDADCGSCRRCAPGANGASTCLAISDCCITSADCEVCQNCTANQCTVIDSCCRFDADCSGCDVCEDYVCESEVRLTCCETTEDCNTAAAILRANNTNPNVTISPCPYACAVPSGSNLGTCIPACSSPKNNTGLIVGLAVGIPLGLLALLALAAIVALIIVKKRDALTAKFVRKDPNLQGDAQSNPLHKPANPVQHNQAYNT